MKTKIELLLWRLKMFYIRHRDAKRREQRNGHKVQELQEEIYQLKKFYEK